MLEWTGERYLPFVDPKISGAEIHYEHLHRYAFAAQFVKGKNVLDFASGEGYGSYMLSKEAESVICIEIGEKCLLFRIEQTRIVDLEAKVEGNPWT
jgi:protein-L-isoaspartate O-methyltransferase